MSVGCTDRLLARCSRYSVLLVPGARRRPGVRRGEALCLAAEAAAEDLEGGAVERRLEARPAERVVPKQQAEEGAEEGRLGALHLVGSGARVQGSAWA